MKKRILALLTITASCSALYGYSYYKYEKSINLITERINSTGLVTVFHEPKSSFTANGIVTKTIVKDKNSNHWLLDTNTKYVDVIGSVKSITTVKPATNVTMTQYEKFIDSKTGALPLILFTDVSADKFHAEASSQPLKLVDSGTTVSLPELQLIHDASSDYMESVILATGDITIDHNSAQTIYERPRLLLTQAKGEPLKTAVKIDGIKVGNVDIAEDITANFLQQEVTNKAYNLNLDASFKKLDDLSDGSIKISINNVDHETIFRAIDLGLKKSLSDQSNTSNNNTDALLNLMEFAKKDGSLVFNMKAMSEKNEIDINSSIRFDPILRLAINENNAFSILQAAKVNANLSIPRSYAEIFINPTWLERFISDKLVFVDGGQLYSEVKIEKMNATINGKKINL